MTSEAPIRLRLPAQDLEQLCVFEAQQDSARDWAAQLPVANPEVVAVQLNSALDEICRCRMPAERRFEILSALQSNLDIACASLSRRCLNQPLVMPEQPRRMAALVDALYARTTTAYACTAFEALQQRHTIASVNPAKLVGEALLRALDYCGRRLLLNFQLHQPVAADTWLTLHQLYLLSERQTLAETPLAGADGAPTSIRQCYLVTLLTGCAKPNQLRQSDLTAVHRALAQWIGLVTLGVDKGLFLVDLERDQPPLYAELFAHAIPASARKVDTAVLVTHMRQLLTTRNSNHRATLPLADGSQLAPGLVAHMIEALGVVNKRHFVRRPATGPLAVSIGLSAAHFHAAGDHSFYEASAADPATPTVERLPPNPFGDHSASDIWSQANPEEDYQRPETNGDDHRVSMDTRTMAAILNDEGDTAVEPGYPIYHPQVANASPGGYCLDWQGRLPTDLQIGDLVSAQEGAHSRWLLAVIRWVSQLEHSRTLIGIELLSPRMEACGAVIWQKTGEPTAPQRVLLLPEIKLLGQPQSLVTPRAGFREGLKLTLQREAGQVQVQLHRQIAATGRFSQFQFRSIHTAAEIVASDHSGPLDSAYDSVWSKI